MSTRSVVWSAALAVVLASLACEKLPERPTGQGKIVAKPMGMGDAIPLAYGDLVGVVPTQFPGSVLLFFQRPDKTVVAVGFDLEKGSLSDNVFEVPRR